MSGLIAGVDEVGRGPLAGPVVAAAVILDPKRPIRGLRDSKQLTPERRSVLARRIRARALAVAIAEADHGEVDLFNILQATLLAMKWALLALPARPSKIMIDGNFAPQLHDCFGDCAVRTIVRGDALVPCISAASIIAKTHRDALMHVADKHGIEVDSIERNFARLSEKPMALLGYRLAMMKQPDGTCTFELIMRNRMRVFA